MGVSYNFPLPLICPRMVHYSSCCTLCCIDDIFCSRWIFKLLNYPILISFVKKPKMFCKYMLILNCFSFCSFGLLMCLLTLNEDGPKHLLQVSQHSKCIHMTNVITHNLHDENEIMVLVV